jgi:hypothetical protein
LNGEVEDDDGDLLSTSEEQGGVQNGGARRRAPATGSVHVRERESDGEEGRAARKRRKGRGWFFVASRGSRTSPRSPGHKQEVAHGLARDSHAATPWDSTKKTKKTLQFAP